MVLAPLYDDGAPGSLRTLYGRRSAGGGGGGGSGTPQPDFANVSLLLHGDGTDGATGPSAIVDSSSNAFVPSAAGASAELDTAQLKWGTASIWFHGSRIDYANDAAFQLGGGDFTFETWIRFNTVSAQQAFCSRWKTSGNDREYIWDWNPTVGLRFVYSTDGSNATVIAAPWSPTAGVWYHVAICRNGTNVRHFVDGAQVGSTFDIGTSTIATFLQKFQLGVYEDTISILDAWMDDLRVTKGEGIYTENFTSPTSAHPDP